MNVQPKRKKEYGIAILIVMMVVTVLSILAAGFAYSMKVEMRLARTSNNDPTMEWLGRSGVELARYVIGLQTQVPGQQQGVHTLSQKWAGGIGDTNGQLATISLTDNQLGPGKFSIKIVDSERKLNINRANEQMLRRAFEVIGVEVGEDSTITDSILDWIDKDEDNRLSGAESDYYMALQPPYTAKNGYIDHINELLLIRGITPDLFWGPGVSNAHEIAELRMQRERLNLNPRQRGELPPLYNCGLVDLFTALAAPSININTAGSNVLRMLPVFADETLLSRFLGDQLGLGRAGPDNTPGTEDDVVLRTAAELYNFLGIQGGAGGGNPMDNLIRGNSATFEVEVTVEMDGITKKYYAVLRAGQSARDPQILSFYW